MELLLALLTGASSAMFAASLWRSARSGWLLPAMIGAAAGALGLSLFDIIPSGMIESLAVDGDFSYLLRLAATSALCGVAALWALGAAARLWRR